MDAERLRQLAAAVGVVAEEPLQDRAAGVDLRFAVTAMDFDRVFSALADATRRDIVRRAIAGEEGVAELADHYPMSFAAVQKHVAVLERAGLVTKQRIGRRKVVRTRVEGLRAAQRLLDRYEELWRGRIDRMTKLITDTEETDA